MVIMARRFLSKVHSPFHSIVGKHNESMFRLSKELWVSLQDLSPPLLCLVFFLRPWYDELIQFIAVYTKGRLRGESSTKTSPKEKLFILSKITLWGEEGRKTIFSLLTS
jgi:hypothetical protein